MGHNISTFQDEITHHHNLTPGIGVDGDYRSAAVLAVRDREGRTGRVYFRPDVGHSGHGVMINPWTDDRFVIEGEDLFALRELLNELPEEAFVRPADPKPEVFTLVDGDGDVWAFREGYWACGFVIHSESTTGFEGFDSWEEIERAYGIDDGAPGPEWIEGDVIVYEGHYVSSVYTRGSETWTRVRTRGAGGVDVTPSFTDAQIDGWVSSYNSYRAIRKGGVDL